MRKLISTSAVIVAALALAGCQAMTRSDGNVSKQGVGMATGAVLGGLVAGKNIGKGSGATVAAIGGTLLGAFIGSEIGKSLDNADLAMLNSTQQQALEFGRDAQPAQWNNPNSGNAGTVTPTRTYYAQSGQPCRQFEQTIIIDGRAESAYGTACRGNDGVWRIQ
jgi:surface antigen